MPASAQQSVPLHPIEIIRSAVLSQRASGVYVRIGTLGAHCTSQEPPCWERDPREKGVSPFGATLIENSFAPAIDPHEALAALFDAPLAFVDGMADGMDRAEPDKCRAENLAAGRAYIGGWEIGYRFRGGDAARGVLPMIGAGFVQLPPDIDYADPETDTLCHYCESVLDEDGDCVACAPRCLLENTPLISHGFSIDGAGRVRSLAVTA
jgi:hypothetical protein